jgi:phospholipase C
MVAENDWALGQVVDLISHSPIWAKSLILVIEDDSQDGADHVDAHRIPAFVISPWAKRGAVIHTRYDFLSFIRTLEIVVGMDPLNLYDATAVPLYDAFDSEPANLESYEVIRP